VRLSRLVALCVLLLLPCAARADDIGPEQARALQQQLKDWLAGLLGPKLKLPDLPWRITGERDHYKLTWPIPGLDKPADDVAATASLRPLDGGRWSIEDVKGPAATNLTVTVPDTGDAIASGPLKIAFTLGTQDTHAVIDPSFATASTLHIDIGDFALTTDSAKERQEQHISRYLVDTSLKPTQDGRLDLTMDATMDGWKSASQINGGAAMAIASQTMHALGRIEGVSRERVTLLLTAAHAFFSALPDDAMEKGSKTKLPPPARAQLRLMVESLKDMLGAVRLEETIEGLQVEVAGMGSVAIKRFMLAFGGEAPDGKLHAWADFGLDNLDTPNLPPKIAAYLPRHLEVKPSLSGVRTADLSKLALDATEEGADSDSLAPDIAALLSHGGADLGIETLSFDLGPAKIEGTGRITILSPDTWRGEAHVSATGLDELTTQARGNPDLQQALPVLIMLRGLAKPDGDRLVWNIASDGPLVTVNGIDLSQLGGDKSKGKPPGQPPKR
jgi:hypothetical protein